MSNGTPSYGAHGLAIAADHVPDHVTLPTPPNANAGAATHGSEADEHLPTLPTTARADDHAGRGLDIAAGHVPDHVTLPDLASLTGLDFFPHG
jgi:pyridoxine 5'-phosphate synthase PdxJ